MKKEREGEEVEEHYWPSRWDELNDKWKKKQKKKERKRVKHLQSSNKLDFEWIFFEDEEKEDNLKKTQKKIIARRVEEIIQLSIQKLNTSKHKEEQQSLKISKFFFT